MSTTTIAIILAAVALVLVIAARNGGTRVTQIDRTLREEKDGDDA